MSARSVAVALGALLLAAGCSATQPAAPSAPTGPTALSAPLAFVHDIPAAHPRIPHLEAFAAGVGARSGGALTVHVNPQEEVLAGRDSLDAVLAGTAQIAAVNMAHLEALEPQAGFMNLPFGLDDATMADSARRTAVTDTLADQVRPHGIELVGIMRGADQLLAFPRADVHRLEDLAGRRIRVAGGGIYESIMRGLGADPVAIPIPQIREAMARGDVDGVFTSPGGWTSEVRGDAPHAVHVPGLMMITYGMVADSEWLASLPTEERAAVIAAGREVTDLWERMRQDDERVLAAAAVDGATHTVLQDTEVARWRSATAGVRDGFLAEHPALAERLRGAGLLAGS